MGVLVEPKEGSYVLEWEGIHMCGAECFPSIRKLLRGSPWVAQLVLDGDGAHVLATQIGSGGVVQWDMKVGDWVVRSPHGAYFYMSEGEFNDQFSVVAS